MNNLRETKDNEGRRVRLHQWWQWGQLALAALAVLVYSTSLISFPLLPSGRLVLEEGDVSPQDIHAPRRVSYESEVLTTEAQVTAVQAVPLVYTSPDSELARRQLERARQVLDYLASVRADSFASPAQRRAWTLAVPEFAGISPAIVDQLYDLSDESWGRVQLEIQTAIERAMRAEISEGGLEEARAGVASLVGLDLSTEEAAVTAALARQFIVPNSFYDEAATQAAREQARENVAPVIRTFEANEIIVREGQRLGPLQIEALQFLDLQQPHTRQVDVIGYGILVAIGMLALGAFLSRFQPEVLWQGRQLLLLVLLWSLFLLLARLMIPDRTTLQYLFPSAALGILAASTLGHQVGLALSVSMGGAVGLIGGGSLEMAVYAAAGGVVATLALRRVERLSVLFRAAGLAALAHLTVLLGFYLLLKRSETLSLDVALSVLVAIVNGGVSASLALGGLFLIGPLFDIITTFRLIELSRPDQPLIQRMLREAPGTYHHSLMVANLAEQAAEQIGADALLTRVGAYYHDIGKIAQSYFFIENQLEGVNPHETLNPYASAEIIIGHVKNGLELARRHHLPSRIRAFIPEHHGTNRASFLYERAVQLAGDPALVDESLFHHRGPKPQSRETALVMLADGCEASVRASRPDTPEALAEVIDRIFRYVMKSGQLDECPLTMRELSLVRDSFISTLKGTYHPRIQYPQRVGEKEEEKTDVSGEKRDDG
ncbi:MAG: HDIG domain-containing protein [Anaerolineae bacterium]|nr:HDIG domain-containing protein [Anaerolineae bacterium]